ncbi:MAG: HD domain-containing protein [Lachnospiraceae bacterium]|nr:HD domain-containing protein [Lachnospiraceae bacterium]
MIRIPEQVSTILAKLQESGYEAYIVGGCVRDALLGREPNDWDITTSALPMDVKRIFVKTVDTGLQHGTVTVLAGGKGYEVTTYRVDGVYEDGRHPKAVTFTPSLREDLQRRDFTINAMAYREPGVLVDLFGGQKDLADGVIRAVGDPVQRFSEDALRILRAIRFSAQLGYRIEDETLRAASELAVNLRKISAERIRVELEKTITSDHPALLRTAHEAGITAMFLPEFDQCMETRQNNPHHCYTVGEHILKSMELIRNDRILRLTMLLHDVGKPACLTTDEQGIDHFYGHQEVSASMAQAILKRLKYDNDTIRKVVKLVRCHDMQIRLTAPAVRKAVVKIGEDLFPLFLEVKQADLLAQSTYQREDKQEILDEVKRLYAQIIDRGDCLNLKHLAVNGSDLVRMGVRPGREVGDILARMLNDVLDVPSHNDKDYLLGRFVAQ